MERHIYNVGPKSTTIYKDGGPITGPTTPEVVDAIKAGEFDKAILLLAPAVQVGRVLLKFGDVLVRGGHVLFKGRALNNGSAERIIQLLEMGLPVESEIKCLASLMRHDDQRVIEAFEDFLDRWQIPRTDDGRIVLCKAVRDDFKDLHTGTVDWSVGQTVRMDWADVDRDPRNTCSRGLHAAPISGAQSYMRGGAHLVELYISPEHIASLPIDYTHCGKIRVVEAYVSRVIPDEVAANYYDTTGPLVSTETGEEDEDAAYNADAPSHEVGDVIAEPDPEDDDDFDDDDFDDDEDDEPDYY